MNTPFWFCQHNTVIRAARHAFVVGINFDMFGIKFVADLKGGTEPGGVPKSFSDFASEGLI